MVEFDPNTITLSELAELYSEDKGLKSKLSFGKILGPYKDQPALAFFAPQETSAPLSVQALKDAQEITSSNSQKAALKTMRYLSNYLYNAYENNPPDFLINNSQNTPSAAQEFFGQGEPGKAQSTLSINSDPDVREEYFKKLMKYAADNPDKRPHVRAILFGLNTGLRPSANIELSASQYLASKGALYISPDSKGAKGRAISIPLNNIADSMLQQQLQDYREQIKETGRIFVDTKGKPLKTADINAVLEQIKVPQLVYDSNSGKYYDSFKPTDSSNPKFGMSLFRNYHTTVGLKLGIAPLVLAKLQGRSTKSSGMASTGELLTYDSTFPGDVSDYERKQANMFTQEYEPQIERAIDNARQNSPDFNFDHGVPTDTVVTRITAQTDGFGEEYFKRPVEEQALPEKIDSKTAELDDKTVVNRILKGFGKIISAVPVIGAGAAIGLTASDVEADISEGADPFKAIVGGAVDFTAEELTPLGIVEPLVEGVSGPVSEEYNEQVEETNIPREEDQIFRLFGETPFK